MDAVMKVKMRMGKIGVTFLEKGLCRWKTLEIYSIFGEWGAKFMDKRAMWNNEGGE